MKHSFLLSILLIIVHGWAPAADWATWGRDPSRNMVAGNQDVPTDFSIGQRKANSEEIDLSTTRNIKWVTQLGSLAYGNVTVASGRVLIGTNNDTPKNPAHVGDRGVLLCLDEKNGSLLWQLVVPKLVDNPESDLQDLGICSSPTIENNRVYVVTNRCEVLCLDLDGLANGNDGPFLDEAAYMTPSGKPVVKLSDRDADILWRYDMRQELQVVPHNISSSSVLVVGDRLFVTTSNGKDGMHDKTPSPDAPCLIALDKQTGKLLGTERSGISQRMFHCNWSSPSYGVVQEKEMVFFGGGDGYCYAFDPVSQNDTLQELWRYHCIPEDFFQYKYTSSKGPSEIIATPVFYENYVYVSIGQDPENGDGAGCLSCMDASLSDPSSSRAVWTYRDIRRSLSTPSIVNDLLFVADYAGFVHCLDAKTGAVHWVYDTQSCIWGSTLVVGDKLYIANEDGYLIILAVDTKEKVINTIDMGAPVYSSPVAANNVLYISTQTHLFAIHDESR